MHMTKQLEHQPHSQPATAPEPAAADANASLSRPPRRRDVEVHDSNRGPWYFVFGTPSHQKRSAGTSTGPTPAEYLELIPAAPESSPKTPIVYFHGGGWISGSSDISTYRLLDFVEAGHPAFNVEYPLAPEHPHPRTLRSTLAALAWIRRHHPEYQSVHLMGDSAGANLAMMAAIMISNPSLAPPLGVEMTAEVPADPECCLDSGGAGPSDLDRRRVRPRLSHAPELRRPGSARPRSSARTLRDTDGPDV